MRTEHWGFPALLVLIAVALVGCVHQPQNPQEFRQCVMDGHGRKDSIVVKRPFDDVYLSIHDKAVPGFTQRFESTVMSGYQVEHTIILYRCKLTGEGGRAELVVQKEPRPGAIGPTMPEGGWYWLVADLEAESPQDTRVTTYGIQGPFSGTPVEALEAIKQWAQGKDVPAPSLK
jgi:hypothetical protein